MPITALHGIPDFQSIMLPLLKLMRDGQVRASAMLREELADHYGPSEKEQAELLPSGSQPVFTNRVAWAIVPGAVLELGSPGALVRRDGLGVFEAVQKSRSVP